MTPDQYAALVLDIFKTTAANIKAEANTGLNVETRFLFNSVVAEEDWVSTLRVDGKIRMLVLLCREMPLSGLGGTTGGRQFKPRLTFGLELFHEYRMGTDDDNTEGVFISDAARVLYALGKHRTLPGQSFIDSATLRLGMRASKVQSMHYGRGEVIVTMQDVRYD